MDLYAWTGIFIVSLFTLIKASDYFTDSAEKIGVFFRIPPFIVGVTIVSIGTSLPELGSSLFAVFMGNSEIVAGNVVGSNIANIFLVLGVAAIISRKLNIGYELSHVDLPMLVSSAFLLLITMWDGTFTTIEALICIICLIIYITYTINVEKTHKDKEIKKETKEIIKKEKFNWTTLIILILSGIFIYFGAKYTIESVVEISKILGIGAEIIAVSAVALGTSLPELFVTISAASKGKPEIAVGNVLGSNIFNSFAVMGIPALFGSLVISPTILSLSLPIMLIATLLFFFVTLSKQVTRWEGYILVIFYLVFIGKLFSLF